MDMSATPRSADRTVLRALPGLFGVLFAVLALGACSSGRTTEQFQAQLNGWIGKPEAALIQAWGPPDRSYETREIKYLTWERRSIDVQPRTYTSVLGSNRGFGVGTGVGWGPAHVTEWTCDTTFEVSHDGIVEGWQYQGNNCVAR